ncbi:TetR/AcrR family transcriptional regulator [Rhizobium sp. BK602]|uniref:TetR/AcrR family transcriptional regulator n=1 Tax=Rhizobium sp. BK602 TaxID=2586986 RepID=UPI00161FC427|nr:TetR/AcrR family transcriptional regulator [Rhizobium sp. BK602]MBB3613006.1 AcrR family transcriptional regulator [Rhizobium sp. BK602]
MPRLALSEEELTAFRAKILKTATAIIAKAGFAGLSMRALAADLRLTPGALYRYFSSKQDLLRALWEDAIGCLHTRFEEIDATVEDEQEAIIAMLKAYAVFALEDHDRFRLLFLENDHGATDVLQLNAVAQAPYAILCQRIGISISSGLFKNGNSEQLAHVLWACVHGAVTLVITVREFDFGDAENFVDLTIATAIRGLAAGQRRNDE